MSSAVTSTSTVASNMQNNTTTLSDGGTGDSWLSTTPRIVFLAVFIGFGFFGNLFLVITVCQSRRFRSMAFFVFVINLAVINMCECLLNMSLLMASSALNEWKFGELACQISSFFLQMISKETILALTITTADRFVAVRFKEKYDQVVSTPRIAIFITFTWVQAFSFSVPVAAGAVPTRIDNYIMYCTLSQGSSLIYTAFSVLLCLIVPLVLMIVFFIKIIRTGYKDRYFNRNLEQHRNYNEEAGEEPRFKQEFRHTNLTATLCVAWLILDGPHVVTSYFSQLSESTELNNVSKDDINYVWYVDLVLLWLRFSYVMALPITAFTWSKDLWKCFKDFILCRKNNSIIDESFKKGDSDTLRLEKKIKEEKMKEKESMMQPAREQRVFQVPVLFATSHGVHIKTFNQNETSDTETDDVSNKTGTWKGKQCDVEGSRDHLNNVEDDTSDYDSDNELDPFSVSHPVSVRQLNGSLTERTRSLSEPEVRDNRKDKHNEDSNTVGATSNGDSGVDLSTSHDTNASKNKFHVPSVDLMLQNTQLLQTEVLDQGNFTIPAHERSQSDGNSYAAFPSHMCVLDEKETPNIPNEHDHESDVNSVTNFSPKKLKDSTGANTVSDSPLPKRKKKRKKDKNFDTQSITSLTSNGAIPPRPPPRLAPIVNNLGVKSLYSGPGRPGSSCSSQGSILDSNYDTSNSPLGLNSDGCVDITKTDVMSFDNVSISSFSMRRSLKTGKLRHSSSLTDTFSNNLLNGDGDSLQLDCKREIDSVPEEVLSPSDCHVQANSLLSPLHKLKSETTDSSSKQTSEIIHEGYEQSFDQEFDVAERNLTPTKNRNTEARRKRREKLSATRDILTSTTRPNDGYQRLVPETP